METYLKRGPFACLILAVVTILLLRAEVVDASSLQQCGTWSVIPSPGIGPLNGVTAISTNNAWAVGTNLSNEQQPLIEHWDGTQWSSVQSPTVKNFAFLYSVAAVSANDIWAVGSSVTDTATFTLIEHWDGKSWSVVPSPTVNNFSYLRSVAVISSNDVWAVGGSGNYPNKVTLTEHWDGSQWSIVPSPSPSGQNTLQGVTTVSSNDVWAFGGPLFLHWDGSQWSVVAGPPNIYACAYTGGITAISSNDVWMAGCLVKHTHQPLTEHWDGSQWSVITNPKLQKTNAQLFSIAAGSTNNIWAVGTSKIKGKGTVSQTLTEHWDGTQWSIVPSPDPGSNGNALNGVAVIGTAVWAVGAYNSNTLIEYYC